jgi:hypothetical protein
VLPAIWLSDVLRCASVLHRIQYMHIRINEKNGTSAEPALVSGLYNQLAVHGLNVDGLLG